MTLDEALEALETVTLIGQERHSQRRAILSRLVAGRGQDALQLEHLRSQRLAEVEGELREAKEWIDRCWGAVGFGPEHASQPLWDCIEGWRLGAEDAEREVAALRAERDALLGDAERYRTLRGLAVKHEQVRICWVDFADPGEPADLQWSVEVGQYEREDYLAPEKTLDAVLDNAARAQAPGGERDV